MPPIMIRKRYGYTASVVQGTNKVIACTKAEWGAIRDNSFITLGNDEVFYKVISKKRFAYKKPVTILNSSQLKINENIGVMLGLDDDLSFVHDEFRVQEVGINNGGAGYEVGDLLKPEGGICRYNSFDEIDIPAQIKVTEVNDDGKILGVELTNSGIYNVPPEDICSAISGLGEGASLNLVSVKIDESSIEDRAISSVDLNEGHTIIHLNHDLPPRIQSGSIKVEKWELLLNTDYVGDSKFSTDYEVIKDFTPNLDLPLIHGDIRSSHLLYNEAMAILDQRIKEIEDKLSS